MKLDDLNFPHRRLNPLTGQWILVSPHRTQRPWQGAQESVADTRPEYDPGCYLCPGNKRAGDKENPDYASTYVFTNDYPAVLEEGPETPESASPLLRAEAVRGTSRVICFSPRHDLTLPRMPVPEIRNVVDTWADQTDELSRKYAWVQVFENKGAAMGCSNPHPHGQVWATDFLPNEILREDSSQRQYMETHGRPLLLDYLDLELASGERTVAENADWLAVVPFWATWPYEVLLLPKVSVRTLFELESRQRDALADCLKQLLIRYDNLFETSFPYSMGWHGAPFNGEENAHWQLHAHFYPPLLRSATVKKFMVGYEMMAEQQRDLTAEQAAQRLRDVSAVHYLGEE